ncbi:MAG: HEAT repeat domain-containing protein, partial [Candidatus Binatia bacterium]
LTERARNALLSGDTDEAMKALNELSRSGREGLRVLEELYASLEDPAARRSLLGPLLFSADREEGLLFLGSELASEDDPAMRDALLAVTSEFVTRGTSSALEAAFLRGAETSGNPSVQAAALRALRYARGPQVEQALLNAASSPHEGVRLAAFEQIALRPELRRRIADLIRRDPSQRVRRIGECRLLIAESGR